MLPTLSPSSSPFPVSSPVLLQLPSPEDDTNTICNSCCGDPISEIHRQDRSKGILHDTEKEKGKERGVRSETEQNDDCQELFGARNAAAAAACCR